MNNQKQESPSIHEMLINEKKARKEGSGITLNSLEGNWYFRSVWKKGKTDKDEFSTRILQYLSAGLKLNIDFSDDKIASLLISNSVKLGLIALEFKGKGELTGKQPLLSFYFDRLVISFGRRQVFIREIDILELSLIHI